MDYPQYVLERQRAALAALLLGRTEARGHGEQDGTRRNMEAAERGRPASGGGLSRGVLEEPLAAGRAAESRPEAERVSWELEEAGRSAGAWAGVSAGNGERRRNMDTYVMDRKWQKGGGTGGVQMEEPPRETGQTAEPVRERSAPLQAAGKSGGVWPTSLEGFGGWGANPSARTDEPWSGGGTEASARALSLAVQRDARRYDGGFAPY